MTEARSIKEAIHNTIHLSRKSVEAIAEEISMSPNYLYRAALPDPESDGDNATGVRFPLKKLIPLVRATNDFQILDFIESSVGRVAIKLPCQKEDISGISAKAVKAAAEFGDIMTEINSALSDGKISQSEAKRVAKEGYEAVQAITALVHAVKELAK